MDDLWATFVAYSLVALLAWVWYRVGRWHQRRITESRRLSVARFALMAAAFLLMMPVSIGYAVGRMVEKRTSQGGVAPR